MERLNSSLKSCIAAQSLVQNPSIDLHEAVNELPEEVPWSWACLMSCKGAPLQIYVSMCIVTYCKSWGMRMDPVSSSMC